MDKQNNKKTLVTGGAGFIGSHLVKRLIEDGHEVMVLDNLSSSKLENLDSVKDNPNFSFQCVDVSNFSKVKYFFKGVQWVFHLAALADIVPSIQQPIKYHNANVNGTISILEAARLAGVERFAYAASSSCYGIPDEFPTPESVPARPMYPYALSKYLGEQLVLHWGKVYKLPVLSLRLFNVYGSCSRTSGTYGAVFGVFLAQKLKNKPFTVVGDGSQTRDFVFVGDVVDAFVKAVSSEIRDEIFNVGSGAPQSINKLVSLLEGESVNIPKRPGEPDCTWADITKVKNMLGWKPKIKFEEGVKIMLKNIKAWNKAPLWTPESIEEATHEWFKCLTEEYDGSKNR
jgi:UDP-glucose 4-epimerase